MGIIDSTNALLEKLEAKAKGQRTKKTVCGCTLNKRPPFGQWLRHIWLDLISLLVLGTVGIILWALPWITFLCYLQHSHWPRSWWIDLICVFTIPSAAILELLSYQISIRSFWDMNNAILGLLLSCAGALVFTKLLQTPILVFQYRMVAQWQQWQQYLVDNSDAEGPSQLNTMSRPQHLLDRYLVTESTIAFASLIFLSLYLNAKLKVWADYRPSIWRFFIIVVPVFEAICLATHEALDAYESGYWTDSWFDCLIGAAIGTAFAFSSYRLVYASVFDYRLNHIPLSCSAPFISGSEEQFQSAYESATITGGGDGWSAHRKKQDTSVMDKCYLGPAFLLPNERQQPENQQQECTCSPSIRSGNIQPQREQFVPKGSKLKTGQDGTHDIDENAVSHASKARSGKGRGKEIVIRSEHTWESVSV